MPWLVGSFCVLAVCWALLWTVRGYWNPLFFFGLWTGATIFVRTLQGDKPLPWRRQGALMSLSVPLWWWFEVVNGGAQNWQYHGTIQYNMMEYVLLSSLAFSTVVPALDAAWRLSLKIAQTEVRRLANATPVWCAAEIALGVGAQLLVYLFPTLFYALVWVAPFLVFDGFVGLAGGTNLAREMQQRRWRLAVAIGLAGVGCGFFWELWNFGASPKWTYSLPFLHVLQIFEMPLPGYLGYIPFAWSVFQGVQFARHIWRRLLSYAPALTAGRP